MAPKPQLQDLQTTSCLGKALSTVLMLCPLTFCVHYRVEKYRPVFLDDIVGNTETIERLKIIAKDGNMPHLIISGMPGIGKTTSVVCLARQLLGDAYKEAVLELNASDERGKSSGSSSVVWNQMLISQFRYRCGSQQDQGFRSEEGHFASRPTQDCYPR